MGKMIFVTNTNSFHHTDRYDGEDYEFPPGEKVAISEEAATHMFGRNLIDKTSTLQRLGWAMKYDPKTKNFEDNLEGAQQLARFVFTEAVLVEALAGRASIEPEIA
jgi:hypothetical protein